MRQVGLFRKGIANAMLYGAANGRGLLDFNRNDTAKRMLRERAGITIGTFIRLRCEAMTYINAGRM